MADDVLNAIGLCRKANSVISGTQMICKSMQNEKTKPIIVIEASEVSIGTHKKLSDKCNSYNVPLVKIKSDGEQLAKAIGKTGFIASVAITNENFAKLILSKTIGSKNS